MLIAQTWQFITQHPERFHAALTRHVELSVAALAIAAIVAIPVGLAVARRPRAALATVSLANIGRTLPSLAVLALVMPVLGTGFAPSLAALVLLALPPILINTCAGVQHVAHDVVDAAQGAGMTRLQVVLHVEVPLALPAILAGMRTAAVQVVSGATLAAYIGGGGLGDLITAGIALLAMPQLLAGAIPATLLALAADRLFGLVQRVATPRALRDAAP
jgi:osmoprotectant transport system permease protein